VLDLRPKDCVQEVGKRPVTMESRGFNQILLDGIEAADVISSGAMKKEEVVFDPKEKLT
jgi:hypothetical protein